MKNWDDSLYGKSAGTVFKPEEVLAIESGIARDKARIAELEEAIVRFIAAEQDMLDTFGVPCDNDAVEAEYMDAREELKKLVGE